MLSEIVIICQGKVSKANVLEFNINIFKLSYLKLKCSSQLFS